MKRILASLTVLLLMLLPAASAFAATPDLSYVEANSDVFAISESNDGKDIFITTTLTAQNLHYLHKYESNYYWSFTRFEVAVRDYAGPDALCVWQLWITYANDVKLMDIDSATFLFNGNRFTFSELSNPQLQTSNETSHIEELQICFGVNNKPFLLALEEYCATLNSADEFQCTLILHGEEDVTVTLGGSFALDFLATRQVYIEVDLPESLQTYTGNPMTLK